MTLELPDIQCNRITNENKHWLEAENLIALIALLFTVIFLYPGFGPLLALLSAIIFSLILYFFFHSSLWDKIKIQVLNYFWINLLQLDKRKVELLDYYYQSNEQQKQFNKYSYTLAQNMYIKYEIEKITITAINSPNGARDDIETFIRNQREQHIPIRQTWNSVIYRIYNLIYNEEQKELEITFIPGCYSDYIYTGWMVGKETDNKLKKHFHILLLRRLKLISDTKLEQRYNKICGDLVIRNALGINIEQILNVTNKCLRGGINNVTILKDGDKYKVILVKRNPFVLEFPNKYYIVPAGTFEPSSRKYFFDRQEWEPRNQMIRELYEECFQRNQNSFEEIYTPLNEIFKKDEIRDLLNYLQNPHDAEFAITGAYIEYYDFNAVDITTCLIIHNQRYLEKYREKIKANWESSTLKFIDFTEESIDEWLHGKKCEKLLPIGALAIQRAWDYFTESRSIKKNESPQNIGSPM